MILNDEHIWGNNVFSANPVVECWCSPHFPAEDGHRGAPCAAHTALPSICCQALLHTAQGSPAQAEVPHMQCAAACSPWEAVQHSRWQLWM